MRWGQVLSDNIPAMIIMLITPSPLHHLLLENCTRVTLQQKKLDEKCPNQIFLLKTLVKYHNFCNLPTCLNSAGTALMKMHPTSYNFFFNTLMTRLIT